MSELHAQRGFSLVELMVGIAVGLMLVAAGIALLVANLRESRRLVLEARMMQDLRAVADLVARDLRRAGHWTAAVEGVRLPGAGSVPRNPYASFDVDKAGESVGYRYANGTDAGDLPEAHEEHGFRLKDAAIEMKLGGGPWQALTDNATLAVTHFRVTPSWQDISLASFCLAPGTAQDAGSPPRQRVLSYEIDIHARALAESRLARTLSRKVRLRNDAVIGTCAE